MTKTKKRKLNDFSQAEIWDDSALVRSWNEAVEEYEFYHSIHAKGEDVEEVLRRAELDEQNGDQLEDHRKVPSNGQTPTDGGPDHVGGVSEDGEIDLDPPKLPSNGGQKPEVTNGINGTANVLPEASGPTQLADGSTSDQTLENMKMAYWWAGYYSGLYESQKAGAHRPDTSG